MLSRVADALYWCSRYMERAEHSARLLEVTRTLLIDIEEVAPVAAEQHWTGTLSALGLAPGHTAVRVAFDEGEPGTIASCMGRARENARAVREVISSEMWEHLNQAYWQLREAGQAPDREQALGATLEQVVAAGFLWAGVTDGTMRRGEGWQFVKLGQAVERADRVARLVSVRARQAAAGHAAAAIEGGENVLWSTLLRSCSGLEAYRKVHPARVEAQRVLEFLILDGEFPRSIHCSVSLAFELARQLSEGAGPGGRGKAVERAFGRLAARLDYAEPREVLGAGVSEFLDGALGELGAASLAVQRTYFLH